ncbi:class I SAM-dependent methyltransferase [Candidatus Micrarchaeota archaeon]|nr:class I SAM-dependent methyltransferase [Candidatus Micrarchaeota archaeon]
MALERNISIKLIYLLDNLIPPIIRDSKIFMYPLMWIVFGKKVHTFIDFKEKAHLLSEREFAEVYENVSDVNLKRETDLNRGCFSKILDSVKGNSVLDIGAGKCVLAAEINKMGKSVTAADIVISNEIKEKFPTLIFKEANVEQMPFKDKVFDTVVCTHTLEHVRNLANAIKELRRVCKKRLIVVVPKQRHYRYTFDLHLNFFPYESALLTVMDNKEGQCRVVEGDLFYIEDLEK